MEKKIIILIILLSESILKLIIKEFKHFLNKRSAHPMRTNKQEIKKGNPNEL
jgi:hypothetical protein